MRLTKQIDFQNVGALTQDLKAGKASRERFSLEISERDCANGLYAAMAAEVEGRGGSLSFDADTKAHILSAARWLTHPGAKPSLMLCGLYGNGKTTLAKAMATLISHVSIREYGYSKRMVMRMYTAKEICRLCAAAERFRDSHEEYRRLFTEPMMIIDDLGEEPKEVMVYGMPQTPVIDLLSHRYAAQLTTVITTNLDTDEIKTKYGPRIYDRFIEMADSIVFENDSYRA